MTRLGRRRPGQRRILDRAVLFGDRAARVEPAAARDEHGVRCLALENLRLLPVARIAPWDDRQERLRVRVLRVAHDRGCRPFLHDAAEVHDRDPLREADRRREVVRDHQDRETLFAQAVEHVEDTRPDGDVEHRDRLVGDEHVRLEHERRGDRHPLALAARELVRVPVEIELGRRELDPDECIANPRGSLGF